MRRSHSHRHRPYFRISNHKPDNEPALIAFNHQALLLLKTTATISLYREIKLTHDHGIDGVVDGRDFAIWGRILVGFRIVIMTWSLHWYMNIMIPIVYRDHENQDDN